MHGRGIKTVKFSGDCSVILTGSEDLHMHLTEVSSMKRLLTLVNH